MHWWKRLIFSIISLLWGYLSLDYLYYAFSRLVNAKGKAEYYTPENDGLFQLLGFGMFLLWFFITAGYFFIIKQKFKKKWTDIVLQAAFIITGIILRWGYVVYIYLPKA